MITWFYKKDLHYKAPKIFCMILYVQNTHKDHPQIKIKNENNNQTQ